nr:hel [Herpesvirus DDDp]
MSQCFERYGTFVQRRWVNMVVAHWQTNHAFYIFLLTGEAGCGKSKTITVLRESMRLLTAPHSCALFTATTHTAAEVLQGRTYQSALGFNLACCLATSIQAFIECYTAHRARVVDYWCTRIAPCADRAGKLCRVYKHGCSNLSRRCPLCADALRQHLFDKLGDANVPHAAFRSLLVIDEYGMMTALDFHKVLWTVNLFKIADVDSHTLVLVGSVSQLTATPPRASPAAYGRDADSARGVHASLLADIVRDPSKGHVRSLAVNHRQSEDPEYGRALSMMQFNLVTAEAVSIFTSRQFEGADDASQLPGVVRIFNCNERKDRFNAQATAAIPGEAVELTLHIQPPIGNHRTLAAFYDFLKKTHPKIFSSRSWPGRCQLTVKAGEQMIVKLVGAAPFLAVLTRVVRGAEGAPVALQMKRIDTGLCVRVNRCTFSHRGHSVQFFPVSTAAAINTFSAQGATLQNGIAYCPPRRYMSSPIKPSAYVAMSRVPHRQKLWLQHNPFTSTGYYAFFSDAHLTFRKMVEMCYEETTVSAAATEARRREPLAGPSLSPPPRPPAPPPSPPPPPPAGAPAATRFIRRLGIISDSRSAAAGGAARARTPRVSFDIPSAKGDGAEG